MQIDALLRNENVNILKFIVVADGSELSTCSVLLNSEQFRIPWKFTHIQNSGNKQLNDSIFNCKESSHGITLIIKNQTERWLSLK